MLAYQPMAQADWRDWITRENMTNMIWSKYGAIGGTFVIMAMAAGLWIRSGKSIFGSNEVVQARQQVEPIDPKDAQGIMTELEKLYNKFLPRTGGFSNFVITLLNTPEVQDSKQLIELFKNTLNIKNINTEELSEPAQWLCYILSKEYNFLERLPQAGPPYYMSRREPLLLALLTPKFAKDIAAQIDKSLTTDEDVDVAGCIDALDILFSIERLEDTFFMIVSNKLMEVQIIIKSQDALIELFSSEKSADVKKLHDILQAGQKEIQRLTFNDQNNKVLIAKILNRLIELTKPAEETKEAAAAAGEAGD